MFIVAGAMLVASAAIPPIVLRRRFSGRTPVAAAALVLVSLPIAFAVGWIWTFSAWCDSSIGTSQGLVALAIGCLAWIGGSLILVPRRGWHHWVIWLWTGVAIFITVFRTAAAMHPDSIRCL